MNKVSLVTLKNGLRRLQGISQKRKDSLQERLARSEKISAKDETWLDNAGNYIDEQALLDVLAAASDFDGKMKNLTPEQSTLVDQMTKAAYDGVPDSDGVSKKRKRKL